MKRDEKDRILKVATPKLAEADRPVEFYRTAIYVSGAAPRKKKEVPLGTSTRQPVAVSPPSSLHRGETRGFKSCRLNVIAIIKAGK